MASSNSPSSSGLLPLPGTPSSSWKLYAARINAMFRHPDTRVIVAFWFLGLINNVLYVIILSAAQDLVGSLPKGIVLLADVLPSFIVKLVAPYYIHVVPYNIRVLLFIGLSVAGMLLVSLTPPTSSVAVKMVGVVLASLSSGGGELSFLGLTHYYGHVSLAGWGSGTGAAGLVGAGLYVVLTEWWGLSVRDALLFSACLPAIMFVSFFVVLPHGPMTEAAGRRKEYNAVPGRDFDEEEQQQVDDDDGDGDVPRTAAEAAAASSALLGPRAPAASTAYPTGGRSFSANIGRVKALLLPYMVPLFLVYVAEYTINQGVAPTLLFPVEQSPFREYRGFYPFYSFLYQLGVFISRSSTPFLRIHYLYMPSVLQIANLVLLALQAVYFFIPSVYIIFVIIFWEGLLGGAVYVNAFAEILEKVPAEDREFSLSAATVSDSAGICVAGFIGIALEPALCSYQVSHGRDWCRKIRVQHT